MIDNPLPFLLDFNHFLDLVNERKVILIDLGWGFLHFLYVPNVLDFLVLNRVSLCLGFIAYYAGLRFGGHERKIRVYLLLNLYLFDKDLLFDNGFL